MSDQLNSKDAVQEISDHESAIQFMESQQRHDLAVHLYSTFLSHRVNPYYPPPDWAAWPLSGKHILDPKMAADTEDIVVADSEYAGLDNTFFMDAKSAPFRGFGCDGVKTLLYPSERIKDIHHRRRRVSSPRATLVNEMHFAIQRRLKALVAKKHGGGGGNVPSLVDDSQLMKNMATRLANRLNRVLQQLENRPRRLVVPVPHNYDRIWRKNLNYRLHSRHKRTWQDVLLASCYDEKLDASRVNIEGLRSQYLKMRSLFRFVDYPFEYDPEAYSETDLAEIREIPQFSVVGNLEAIEQAGTGPVAIEGALEFISQRKKDESYKEGLFMGLLDQAIIEKQLACTKPKPTKNYVPLGKLLREQRREFLGDVHLQARDYTS